MSEGLSDSVTQLIETISSLVLCTITGEPQDIGTHAKNLGTYTLVVVNHAKDIAIAAKDKPITLSVVECNNNITQGIEKLVGAVVSLLKDFQNPQLKKTFAENARDVGLAINRLIVVADNAVSKILINSCEKAQQYHTELLKASTSGSTEEFVEMAKASSQTSLDALEKAQNASKNAADPNKAALINYAAGEVRGALADLIRSGQALFKEPSEAERKSELAQAYKNIARIFTDLIDAALISPDYSSEIASAFEQFNRMLDLAKSVSQAAKDLVARVLAGCSQEEFAALAKTALQTTLELLSQAEQALANETDPIRRELLQNAIQATKDSIGALVQAAKAVLADPNNPELRKALQNAQEALDANVQNLIALTSKGHELEKLALALQLLQKTSQDLDSSAPQLTSPQLDHEASRIAAITERVAKDTKAVALATSADPEQRIRILDSVVDLRKAEDRLLGDIRQLSQAPQTPDLVQRVAKSNELFRGQLQKIRYATGLAVEPPKPVAVQEVSAGDSDLVAAAKEQAALAQQIIRDAEAILSQLEDPQKKEQLRLAIDQLRFHAAQVVHFAEIAAKDPENLDKQIQLDEAQRGLADGIRHVVTLTSNAASDLQALMDQISAQDASGVGEVFSLAEQMLKEIQEFVAGLQGMDPKSVVLRAKELAAFAAKLAALVRQVADQTEDPKTKAELIGFSKFLRDRGTQLKMIAAVKVACGGDDGQISSAASGLSSTISETVAVLRVSELKRRRKQTVGRAAQIRKIIEMWQQGR